MKDKLTAKQLREGQEKIKHIRRMLRGEAELLIAEYDQPRLVCYGAICVAIQAAQEGYMTPAQFMALVSDTVGMMTGDQDKPIRLREALSKGNE